MSTPVLLIHGGAGAREGRHAELPHYAQALERIVREAYPILIEQGARAAVIGALERLEDDPLFNAGYGARLQRDGAARLSAALIDGRDGRFAGVINIERVRHPIDTAAALSDEAHRVLAGSYAQQFAREHGQDDFDPITAHRRAEHRERQRGEHGTVGAVACAVDGRLAAGTSTGGVGFERPGRVSDSATVAGTYASANAAVSCTGQGEQIVDHALAARVVTRVDDGLSLADAVQRTMAEARGRAHEYGLISLDREGHWHVGETDNVTTLYAVCTGTDVSTFLSP